MPLKPSAIPFSRIMVCPFSPVFTTQLRKMVVEQETAPDGTPVSTNRRLVQSMPETLVKNKIPFPLAGVLKLNWVPTGTHWVRGQSGSLILMTGSGIELAKAVAAQARTIV